MACIEMWANSKCVIIRKYIGAHFEKKTFQNVATIER